ncbi:hypothetical protein AB0J21_30645 [Streptomyces sp. NPDC049954]|uniref:hypothetical protein n=1 Tax=Streptomyces sp. NPDC049954 TaxID=3155779 RepID=UPI00341F6B3E
MNTEGTIDNAAAVRHARFGALPDRIRFEDMTEAEVATPGDGASSRYNPEASWNHFSCLALDLGL